MEEVEGNEGAKERVEERGWRRERWRRERWRREGGGERVKERGWRSEGGGERGGGERWREVERGGGNDCTPVFRFFSDWVAMTMKMSQIITPPQALQHPRKI